MTESNKFQELLEIIKKYNDNGTDYAYSTQVGGRSSPDNTRNYSYGQETYSIFLPELKKKARRLMLNGDTEDGGICRFGLQDGEKWYQYEKGNGNQPDKLEIRDISPEEKAEIRSRKEQIKRNQEEWEKPVNKKKCVFCNKEIDFTKGGIISKRPRGSSSGYLDSHFCSVECSKKHSDKKYDERENKQNYNSPREKNCAGCNIKLYTTNYDYIEGDDQGSWYCSRECANKNNKPDNNPHKGEKCADCGATWETGEGYWGYTIIDGKTYCDACFDKWPKKSETKKEKERQNALKRIQQTKLNTLLNNLKSKLQNSTNPAEKETLKREIKDIENRLRELENKKNNSNQTGSPKEGYGKIIVAGVVIFSVVILALILIVKTRKKSKIT